MSDPENPSSIITLGSDAHPIIDPLSKKRLRIQSVADINDIEVYTQEKQVGGERQEIVIISLSQPHPFGTGFTIAFGVKNPTGRVVSPEIEIGTKIFAIDQDFRTLNELPRLLVDVRSAQNHASAGVVSHPYLELYLSESESDHPVAREWKATVEKIKASIENGDFIGNSKIIEQVPTLDLRTGRIQLPVEEGGKLIGHEAISRHGTKFEINTFQRFDPSGRDSGVYFGLDPSGLSTPLPAPNIPGLLSVKAGWTDEGNTKGMYHIWSPDSEAIESNGTMVVAVDADLYLVLKGSDGKAKTLLLRSYGSPSELPEEISLYHQTVDKKAEGGKVVASHFVIVSSRGASGKDSTVAYEVSETKQAGKGGSSIFDIEIAKKLEIIPDSFLSYAQLLERTSKREVETEDGNRSVVVFDVATSPEVTGAQYRALEMSTRPVLSLTDTHAMSQPSEVFGKPLLDWKSEKIPAIGDRHRFSWRLYRDDLSASNRTGFHYQVTPKARSTFIAGHPAWPPSLASADPRSLEGMRESDFVLTSDLATKSKEIPAHNIAVVPFISTAAAAPQLRILLSLTEVPEEYGEKRNFDGALLNVELGNNVPIEQLRGAMLVNGVLDFQNQISLLLLFEPGEETFTNFLGETVHNPLQKGGVALGHFQFGFEKVEDQTAGTRRLKAVWEKPEKFFWLHQGAITPEAIVSRLVRSKYGSVAWIKTPSLDTDHSQFAVCWLAEPGKTLYPNRGARHLKLQYGKPLEDVSTDFEFDRSEWELRGRGSIHDLLQGESWYKTEKQNQEEIWKTRNKGGDAAVAKLNKKSLLEDAQQVFPELLPLLDRISLDQEVIGEGEKVQRHRVILLDPEMKTRMYQTMLLMLQPEAQEFGIEAKGWSLSRNIRSEHDRIFRPHLFAMAGTEAASITEELGIIRDTQDASHNVLLADITTILAQEPILLSAEMDGDTNPFATESDFKRSEKEAKKVSSSSSSSSSPSNTPPPLPSTSQSNVGSSGDSSSTEGSDQSSLPGVEDAEEGATDVHVDPNSVSPFTALALEGKLDSPDTFRPLSERQQQVPMIILSTTTEWNRARETFPYEAEAGVFDSFEVDRSFLTSAWTLWRPGSPFVSDEVKRALEVPVSAAEHEIFSNLSAILEEAAKGESTSTRKFVIVPEELRDLVHRLVISRWASDPKIIGGSWNHENPDFALFRFQEKNNVQGKISQESIATNFDAIRAVTENGRNAVVLGTIAELSRVQRPTSSKAQPFMLVDSAGKTRQGQIALQADEEESPNDQTQKVGVDETLPHVAYLMGVEGLQIQPEDLCDGNVCLEGNERDSSGQITQIYFGTESELETLRKEMSFEDRFGYLDTAFTVEELTSPTTKTKRSLLTKLFTEREILSLDYQVQIGDGERLPLSEASARDSLCAYIVNRVDRVAHELGIEPTTAFVKLFGNLRDRIVDDTELRRHRLIDQGYVERMLAGIFPIPVSLDNLPDGHWLHKAADPAKSAIELQHMRDGYDGPLALKERVIETVLHQTKAGTQNSGRPVPNSVIIMGDSGTGKTFLVETLIRYFGLKEYDLRDRNRNDDASALIITVDNITEDDKSTNPDILTTAQATEAIEDLIARCPNPLILFDDIQKARGEKVVKWLLNTFSRLMNDDYIRVKRLGDDTVIERPTRHINLYVTANDNPDAEIRKKFNAQDPSKLFNRLVAALSRPKSDLVIDDSIFKRFSDIINLDLFPRSAKVSSLVRRIRTQAQAAYGPSRRLVLVDPQVLELLADRFEESHAREFLSTVALKLVDIDVDVDVPYLAIVKPRSAISGEGRDIESMTKRFGRTTSSTASKGPGTSFAQEIEAFLREETTVSVVTPDEFSSQLDLISFIADAFRVQVANGVVQAAQVSPLLASDKRTRSDYLTPFFFGLLSNLEEKPTLPLSAIRPNYVDVGVTSEGQAALFREALEKHTSSDGEIPFFPIEFSGRAGSVEGFTAHSFFGTSTDEMSAHTRRRIDVLREVTQELSTVLGNALSSYFYVESVHALPTPGEWFDRLPESLGERKSERDVDPSEEAFKRLGAEITESYVHFFRRFADPGLVEMIQTEDVERMTSYDFARVFLMALDKAIVELPWGRLGHLLHGILRYAKDHPEEAQASKFQTWLFDLNFSPTQTTTIDYFLQVVLGSRELKDMEKELKGKLRERYRQNCEKFLIPEKTRTMDDPIPEGQP